VRFKEKLQEGGRKYLMTSTQGEKNTLSKAARITERMVGAKPGGTPIQGGD